MNHQLTGVRLLDGYRIESESRDVTLEPAHVRWLDAQTHSARNIGETPTHVVFIELKEAAESARGTGSLGLVDR